MSATCSVYIEAPVEKVFAFYQDPRKAWEMTNAGELIDVKMTEEGVGTYYSWGMRLLPGLRWEGFGVFTEFVPNKRITDRSSESFIGTWTYTFEPEGSGTRVTAQRHPVSSRALRPIDRLIDRVFRQHAEKREFTTLKALLETSTTSPAASPRAAQRDRHTRSVRRHSGV